MALAEADRAQSLRKHRLHTSDTGSADVQVALLTHRINALAGHLRDHNTTTTPVAGCSDGRHTPTPLELPVTHGARALFEADRRSGATSLGPDPPSLSPAGMATAAIRGFIVRS